MRPRGARRAALLLLIALVSAGCSIPSWVPLIGRDKAEPNVPPRAANAVEPVKSAPLMPGGGERDRAAAQEDIVDRVVCVVNNDAITQYELEEAESYHLYENRQPRPEGQAQ